MPDRLWTAEDSACAEAGACRPVPPARPGPSDLSNAPDALTTAEAPAALTAATAPNGPRPPKAPPLAATLLATMRPPFLLLTVSCVALGVAAAGSVAPEAVSAAQALWVLLGALAAHAAVNVLNEWHDLRSGLDLQTRRTPFSGGSGALPAQPQAAPAALALGLALLGLTALVGLQLLWVRGPALLGSLLPIGLAGTLLVVAYTPWVTRQPAACLVAPGLGFGPLMVVGTQLALAGQASWAGFWASLMPGCLVSGLLLLNQFPDVDADRGVGRRHLPMLWGRPRAARVLAGLLVGGLAVPMIGVLAGWLPLGTLAAWLTLPLAAAVARGAWRHADDLPELASAMGLNVALNLAAPALMAVGWWAFSGA